MKILLKLLKDEEGQGMVEYGIIIALISVVAIGIIKTIGTKLHNDSNTAPVFDYANHQLEILPKN